MSIDGAQATGGENESPSCERVRCCCPGNQGWFGDMERMSKREAAVETYAEGEHLR